MTSIQESFDRVSKHKGVLGLVIAGNDGVVHKSTLDDTLTQLYADMIPNLTNMARSMVRDLDPLNEMEFLRVRSFKHEILVAPKDDYVLIVVQDIHPATA